MSTTRTFKLYSEMTKAEQAAIDADEDRREARKAAFVGADVDLDARWSQAPLHKQIAREMGMDDATAQEFYSLIGFRD